MPALGSSATEVLPANYCIACLSSIDKKAAVCNSLASAAKSDS